MNDAPTIDTATGSTQVENVAKEGDTVATFTASDLDGDDVTYSITSGNDNGYFAIDSATGVVTLTAAGETALANDALTDTDYRLGVTANDGTVDSEEAFATIKFDGVNDAPTIDTATGSTQVENVAKEGDTVATFTASDLDGDDVTYSITSGNDNGYFAIDSATGVVTLTAAGETALANDALTDTDYRLGVTANDGTVDSEEAFATIKFDGVNDAPTIDTATGSTQVENVAKEGDTVATFTASDLDGDDVTYSITSGNDNGYFAIDSATGVVTLTAAGETALANDALTDTDYRLGVTANDGTVDSEEAFATIKFDGVNDAPTIDTATGSTQVENVAKEGDTVATFTASDLDGDDVTYSITSGNDNGYFAIDSATGVVTLTAAGETALANDALTDTDYRLGVTANDGTVDSEEAFATIKFDGVNDAPTIDTATGSTQVENVAKEGDTVATFTASDLDGDDVTYSITSGNDNGYFAIDSATGVVTLTAAGETALANDALTDTDYRLGVTANDGTVDSEEAFATIKFDGVNDAPTIDTATGSTQVENVAKEGDTVATFTASDLDGDDVTYSITSGNDNGYFAIDSATGVVTLTAAGETALANDALTDTDYRLGVTANDGTVDSEEAFATIKFDGVNDAPTIDTATGSTQVENVAKEGDTVATFTASDLDGDDVTYSITSGNDNGYFAIDSATGVVTLTAAGETALANDALTDTDYRLGVTANDGTVDSEEAFATIKFDGVNDAPTIDTATGSTQVENVAKEGDTVATFTASDLDGDDVTYSITSGNDNGYFAIDSATGVVTLTAAGETALANDALTDTDYRLGVTANDGTVDSEEAFATIKFDGVNDAPTIDTATGSTQVENVAKEGDTVATFTASDLDGDDVTYSITSGNDNGYFAIDSATGVVTLTAAGETALANDALTDTDYRLGVTANDGTVDSEEAFATIKFDGVNDAPTIDTATGSTQVENVAKEGDTVATFTASDLDGDDVTYSITSGNDNGYFAIDSATGVVTLTAAGETALANDALTDTDYRLGVTANDGTVDSEEAFATIKFDGVNDAPTIDTATGSTQVENVAKEGDTVATFTASDLDGDDVTYSITSGNDNGYFAIDSATGVVTLTAAGETALANDALTDTDYRLGVTANDGTVDSEEAFATIKFDGVNDAPTIDTATGSTQVENVAKEGDTVATFTASDLDGDDVTYSITSGNDNGYFAIDSATGVVTLTAAGETALANDALTDTDYRLGVTANDGTVDSEEAFATIKFDGVNDAPTIDTATGSTQVENVAKEGDTVATFTASDLDGDDVTYSITSGNDNGYFAIDSATGVVTLTAAGETALANDALTDTDYRLGVTANDGTVDSEEAFATIKFDGVNDAPTIDTATGSTQVENVAKEGDTVATFTASDLDGDDVTYSITSGNDNGYFAIDSATGVVTLTAAGETALANDALTDTDYRLGVTANDGTVDSEEAFATIKFDGVNDAPTIDTATGSTQVENVAKEGDTVATFTASDLDGDDVTYSITSGNDNGYFAIDSATGVVTLTAAGETALANDALTDTDYRLGVTANDGTVDSEEAFATIKFDGVNDAPTIDTATGSTQVENVAKEGDTVATFTASDLDGDDVTYSITSGNDNGYFAIDSATGVVTLTAAGETALANDALTDTDYRLGVTANDGTVDSEEAFATIKFDGVNDAPTIDTATGSTQVENVAKEGDTVATFTASDLDGDDVTYSITSGNDNGYFAIDSATGVVTLTAAGETALANDALTDTDYRLGVTANDGTVDSEEAFATIKFDGVNDAPTIDTATGSTQVENVAKEGDTVATFTASDLDGDDVTYSITSGNDNGYFAIDSATGVVTLTAAGETALANDALTDTDYRLGVTANDGTVDSEEAFATIKFDGVNDAPTIDTATGSTQVENVAKEGDTVATFTASDLDGDDVTYSITSGNDNGYFAIDSATGVVTLTAAGETALANDALTDTDYRLGVTANDGTVDSEEAFATIKFDGVNDAPTIDTATGSTQVENVAKEGDTVATFTASDLDGDDVTYSITSGNDNGYFAIDSATGVVTLTAAGETALANDALTDTDYRLGVTANDGTVDSEEAFATIKFDGVNDAPTIDTATGSTQVENVAKEGDTVATFTASDLDGDDVTYSITSGNDNGYFAIDSATGVVTLTAAGETALANDALTDTDYRLGVTANDGTVDSEEAFATIKFDGVNDAPTIDTATGSTQVENVAKEGDTVATFTASDLDGDDVTYSITSGNDNGYFAIDSATGVVTLTAAGETALANDALTDTDYRLGVTANDGTVDSEEAFATIKFDGVNDAPTIDTATGSTQVENVAKEGDTVATFTASDLDGDDVTYSITSGNDNGYFAIDSATGVVTLTAAGETALANDALTDTDYRLGVTANDGTVDSEEAFATIKFDGVNDAPTIDTATGSTQVENVAKEGDTVATFTASDLDGDDVTYSITSGNDNGYFAIDSATGVVTLTAAGETALANDALTDTDYRLGVTANDGTVDSEEAFATIKFDGVNDAPTIDTATGSTQVENVAKEGDTVATFTASDLDGDDVTYSITSGNDNGYFAIDSATGVVTLTAAGETALANDALTDTDYRLGVTANDGTVDSEEAFATIKFDGVNDAPTIDTATGSTQVENVAKEGDTVATFTASDLDGDDVTYSITSGNDNGYFAIDSATGVVTLTAAGETALANDALTDTDYRLGVTANDGTVDSEEAFATIKFDGVNDAPTIDTATGSTQVENVAKEGDTVATFTASDLDGDDVTYSITSGNDNGYFAIDSATGVVTLTAAGETALANDALTDTDYRLGVTANDGTVDSEEAFATIKFDGVNDAPTIDTATGSTQVENVAKEGDTVATFTASDLDGDDVTYSITSGNDNGYFAIDSATGVVTLTAAGETALANDALTDTDYRLGVTANDGTVDSEEAFATIKFDGVNDAPTIDTATGSTQVENVAKEGDTVATFTASDLDGDDVTYSITSGNDNGYFAIDSATGVVTLTAAGETALANDALTDTDYRLGVTANDGTVDSEEAFATIKFDGVNDAPTIDTATGSTQVENVAKEGDTVATFTASDLDGDDVTYSITSGNDNGYFAIDSATGVVTLTAAGETALANDALTDTDYRLGVTANDGTVDSEEAFATIKFDGVNDAPTIDTATGSTQVENVAKEGDTVATFTASDLDGDDVTYSITSGNDNGYFAIDSATGVVTLTAAGETALANDALTDTDYRLGVTANDGTVDSEEAFATIKFDGVNDAPTIDTATGSTQVENVAKEGDTVATFTASDLDGDDVTYSTTARLTRKKRSRPSSSMA
ncbi:beta strand repeat-containing protein [Vibrio kanaloae]|nr:cadherin repeat domain-containing protein [Vibrio kanaloae]QPK04385.1 cadherin repeat domain-containing protein [Vibrio kanaloae]